MLNYFNEDMLNFFKGEKEFYEFVLLNTDAKVRMNLLNVSYSCYSNKEIAKKWYDYIINKIEDPKAIKKLNQIYSEMIR